jgi:P pilus assembly chaperone PapD
MKSPAGHYLLLTLALFVNALAMPAARAAGGDLLVAPTRLMVREGATAEVLLGNKGTEPATYRVSLLMKKMQPDGTLADVPESEGALSPVLDLISYAPRKVVLAPGQTQTVRVAMRAGNDLADGEYRVHLLFRAVPDAIPASATPANNDGLAIALVPVYGVTIPVIIRKGELKAAARIGDVRLVSVAGKPAVAVDVLRTGNRSVYGALHVMRPGDAKPIVSEKVAVYTEINKRTVTIGLPEGPPPKGPVTVRFGEDGDGPDKVSVEAQASL